MPRPLLAIETSTRAGAVALDLDGACETRVIPAEQRNAAGLLPAIDELLAAHKLQLADVGTVAFSAGPGSFTGLRIAATVARTAQFAAGCRVIAIPTFDVIAHAAAAECADHTLAVVADARRGEVFAAAYRIGPEGAVSVLEPVALRAPLPWLDSLPPPVAVAGPAVERLSAEIPARGARALSAEFSAPRVASLVALARGAERESRFSGPEQIRPLYVRPPECEEVYEQRRSEAIARREKSVDASPQKKVR